MIARRGVLVGALLLAAASVHGQQTSPASIDRQVDVMVVHGPDQAGAPLVFPPIDGAFDFVTTPLAVGGETVRGAPYSGDAVTETVQTLADGNRIVRQSKASVYRDAAGRTRRELGLTMIGNAVNDVGAHRQVQIHDAQEGTMYLLDLDSREARRLPSPKLMVAPLPAPGTPSSSLPPAGVATWSTFEQAVPMPPSGKGIDNAVFIRRSARISQDAGNVESLGTRMMEGVSTEGTRSTQTIAAGQIGNELPITIVSERWFSPELKVLVMSRQSDPRFGETTYRLTNITRAEPAAELFQVPSDFKVVDAPAAAGRMLRIEKK